MVGAEPNLLVALSGKIHKDWRIAHMYRTARLFAMLMKL